MRLVPAQRPVETGEPVFADPGYVDAQLDIPISSQGVATPRVAHGCGSDLRLPEHEFCSADIPTRLAPVRPASGSAYGRRANLRVHGRQRRGPAVHLSDVRRVSSARARLTAERSCASAEASIA